MAILVFCIFENGPGQHLLTFLLSISFDYLPYQALWQLWQQNEVNSTHSRNAFAYYRGSPTNTVSTSTISNSTNFRAIGIKLVLVEFLPDCYVVKLLLVETGYEVHTSTNFA